MSAEASFMALPFSLPQGAPEVCLWALATSTFFLLKEKSPFSFPCFSAVSQMAIIRNPKYKQRRGTSFFSLAVISAAAIAFFCLLSSSVSTKTILRNVVNSQEDQNHEKYLYWGNRIDCPGKHCDSCEGLGHQESSLRCALEEALFLQRWVKSIPLYHLSLNTEPTTWGLHCWIQMGITCELNALPCWGLVVFKYSWLWFYECRLIGTKAWWWRWLFRECMLWDGCNYD